MKRAPGRAPACPVRPRLLFLARLTEAAEASLEAWPEAQAAVLFGSRARGDCRADSDWDIAFITDGGGERCRRVPDGLPLARLARREGLDLQLVALPEAFLNEKIAVLASARPALVSALGELEETLDPPTPSTPSPFC